MRRRPDQPLLLTASLLLAGSMLAACSGSDEGGKDDPDRPQDKAFQVEATLGKVTGRVTPPQRRATVEQVSDVVEAWLAAAYVDGDYPRKDFAGSWPGFTPGAAKLARGDKALTSNASLGNRIDGVEVEDVRVKVDLLGVKGKAQGATARFRLVFTTSGDAEQRVQVGGRVTLTQRKGVWRIFGYDVNRGATAVAPEGEKK